MSKELTLALLASFLLASVHIVAHIMDVSEILAEHAAKQYVYIILKNILLSAPYLKQTALFSAFSKSEISDLGSVVLL